MSSRTKASEQSKRFIEAARRLETDDTPEEFERVFERVVPPKTGKPSHERPAKLAKKAKAL